MLLDTHNIQKEEYTENLENPENPENPEKIIKKAEDIEKDKL